MKTKIYSRITSITSLQNSSHKYGRCEICNKFCDSVFIKSFYEQGSHNGELFGHHACLMPTLTSVRERTKECASSNLAVGTN